MQLRRCTSIFILLLCSLVASCGKSETAVAPSEGAAGQVRELHGTVTATRAGQKPRTLAASDTIFVNDSLHTADDASIVILFAHNNARWQLGSGYQGKVVDSLAWRTKRHEASALVRTEHTQTAAAGRDSEREAAESVETLEIAPAEEMPAPEPSASESKSPSDSLDLSVPHKGESDKDTRHRNQKDGRATTTRTRRSNHKPEFKLPAPPPPPTPVTQTAPRQESAPGRSDEDDDEFMGGIGSSPLGRTGIRSAATGGGGKAKGDDGSEKTQHIGSGTKKNGNKAKRDKRSSSKRSFIQGIGKTCSIVYKQKGSITVLLRVTNSRISQLVVKGDSSLTETKRCIKQKLETTKYQGSSSDKVIITLQ
ncbi:MAG: hypothetical protein JKY56_04595 [Kofleriaceae bacterium]|nr:hypothetical protein [Kofleriaceae bacterium]